LDSSAENADLRMATSWAVACVAYLCAFLVSTVVPTPLIWHLPVERRFTFELHPLSLAADFYGRVLLCAAAGGAALLVARLALRQASRETLRGGLLLFLGWAALLLVFTAGLQISSLARRQPIPAPLPFQHAAE
jgi:hypothetical protein